MGRACLRDPLRSVSAAPGMACVVFAATDRASLRRVWVLATCIYGKETGIMADESLTMNGYIGGGDDSDEDEMSIPKIVVAKKQAKSWHSGSGTKNPLMDDINSMLDDMLGTLKLCCAVRFYVSWCVGRDCSGRASPRGAGAPAPKSKSKKTGKKNKAPTGMANPMLENSDDDSDSDDGVYDSIEVGSGGHLD
jgi:hypothetical protein